MNKEELRTVFFSTIELIADRNLCPNNQVCVTERIRVIEDCVECLSEYVLNSGKFNQETINNILGE